MLRLTIKVIPNAKSNSVEGFHGDVLKVRVQAPPDKGKANEALIEFLADFFNISKRDIKIVAGHTSRLKKLEISANIDIQQKI